MTTAEEIHKGLGFLLEEAEKLDEFVDTYAEHDVFYAGFDDEEVSFDDECRIQDRMTKKFGWAVSEDGGVCSFQHFT